MGCKTYNRLIRLFRTRELAQAANVAVTNMYLFLLGSQMGQTMQTASDKPVVLGMYIKNGWQIKRPGGYW